MIYYLKYILIGIFILCIQSTIIFNSLGFLIVPDIFLVYLFWLSLTQEENILKNVSFVGGILLDMLKPGFSFINTFIYFSIVIILIKFKRKIMIFSFFIRFFLISFLSFYVIIFKEIDLYIESRVIYFDYSQIIFYYLTNLVMMYFIYYYELFLKKDYA